MHSRLTDFWWTGSCAIVLQLQTWTCGNAICWTYSPSQNTTICRHIVSVLDVFSKFHHLVPVNTKSGLSIPSAFWFTFHDNLGWRLIRVRTDKDKEFLNVQYQDMLRDEGLQFHVYKIPTCNFRFWNVLIEWAAIGSTMTLHIKYLRICRRSSEICQGLQLHGSLDHR